MDPYAIHPKVCAQCDKLLPESARYCSRCGAGNVVKRNPSLKQRACPNCQMLLISDPNTAFCPHCGTVMMDMTHHSPPVIPIPKPRKRRWFLMPVLVFVFFGYHWSDSSPRVRQGPTPAQNYQGYQTPGYYETNPQHYLTGEPLIVKPDAHQKSLLAPPKPRPVKPAQPDFLPVESD